MSLNSILYSDVPAASWINLRTYDITNDNLITTDNMNVTGTLTAGTFSIDEITLNDLTVENNINTLNLVASNIISAPNIIATNIINTPGLIVTTTTVTDDLTVTDTITTKELVVGDLATIDELNVTTIITTNELNVTDTITSKEVNVTDTMTSNYTFASFTVTGNAVIGTNSVTTRNLSATVTASLPPISFIGSSANFTYNSQTLINIIFTLYNSSSQNVGSAIENIQYSIIGNIVCLSFQVNTIAATGVYQYMYTSNPGIYNPTFTTYCPIITLDTGVVYNGYVIISDIGELTIYKDSNNDNFSQSSSSIPFFNIFYYIT